MLSYYLIIQLLRILHLFLLHALHTLILIFCSQWVIFRSQPLSLLMISLPQQLTFLPIPIFTTHFTLELHHYLFQHFLHHFHSLLLQSVNLKRISIIFPFHLLLNHLQFSPLLISVILLLPFTRLFAHLFINLVVFLPLFPHSNFSYLLTHLLLWQDYHFGFIVRFIVGLLFQVPPVRFTCIVNFLPFFMPIIKFVLLSEVEVQWIQQAPQWISIFIWK